MGVRRRAEISEEKRREEEIQVSGWKSNAIGSDMYRPKF
jgi:hypothetical protein